MARTITSSLVLSCLALTAIACGTTGGAEAAGSVSWRFDFADWTCSPAEQSTNTACDVAFRGCDNAPRAADGTPLSPEIPYAPIEQVRILAEDPEQQVRPLDITSGCDVGTELQVPLVGLAPMIYRLTLQAQGPGGVVMYEHVESEFDLTTRRDESFDLRAMVGELNFFAVFAGNSPSQCPADAAQVEYRLFADGASAPTLSGSLDCNAGTIGQLVIRNIPVSPQPGANNSFVASTYRVELEGRNSAGDTTYCGIRQSRAIRPGDNSTRENETMNAASSCP